MRVVNDGDLRAVDLKRRRDLRHVMRPRYQIDVFRARFLKFGKNCGKPLFVRRFSDARAGDLVVLAECAPKAAAGKKDCSRSVFIRDARFFVRVKPVFRDGNFIVRAAISGALRSVLPARYGAKGAIFAHEEILTYLIRICKALTTRRQNYIICASEIYRRGLSHEKIFHERKRDRRSSR